MPSEQRWEREREPQQPLIHFSAVPYVPGRRNCKRLLTGSRDFSGLSRKIYHELSSRNRASPLSLSLALALAENFSEIITPWMVIVTSYEQGGRVYVLLLCPSCLVTHQTSVITRRSLPRSDTISTICKSRLTDGKTERGNNLCICMRVRCVGAKRNSIFNSLLWRPALSFFSRFYFPSSRMSE